MFDSDLLNLIVDTALRSFLLLGLVWVLLRFSRRGAASLRHSSWTAALALLFVLPILALRGEPTHVLYERVESREVPAPDFTLLSFLPSGASGDGTALDGLPSSGSTVPLEAASSNSDRVASSTGTDGGPDLLDANERPEPSAPAAVEARAVEPRKSESGSRTLLLVILGWALGAALATWPWIRSRLGLLRLLRRSEAADPALRSRVRKLARFVGYKAELPVHVSEELSSPAVAGFFKPRLFLPRSLLAAAEEDFFATLIIHEVTHLKRRDHLVQGISRLAAILYWFNPFVWLARRELETDRELLTDAEVVAVQENRGPYAEGLLRVLQDENGVPWQPRAALGLFDGSSIGDRMHRIISGELVNRTSTGLQVLVLLASIGLTWTTTELALAGVVAPAELSTREDRIQDEEKVEATIRIRVLGADPGRFIIKDRELDAAGLKETLSRYSVDRDRKYDDGQGMSSTRIIIERGGEQVEDGIKTVLLSCAALKIYRIEILKRITPEPEVARVPKGVLVRADLHGDIHVPEVGIFDIARDRAALVKLLEERLEEAEVREIVLQSQADAPISKLTVFLDLAREAGATSVHWSVDRATPVRLETESLESLASRVSAALPADECLQLALAYLVGKQDESGRISDNDGEIDPLDQGRTALAVLAFLGAGNTTRTGPQAEALSKAVAFLVEHQQEDGFLGKKRGTASVYGHAISGLALAECYGLSQDPTLKPVVAKALAYTLKAQNPYRGWRYQPADGDNDSSVTTWMLLFLKSAQIAGFDVPPMRTEWGIEYLADITDEKTGRVGYSRVGDVVPPSAADGLRRESPRVIEPTTAMANFIRILFDKHRDKDFFSRGCALIREKPPVWDEARGTVDLFYWYFGTATMYQLGGESWTRWQLQLRAALGEHQILEGKERGSWDAEGRFGVECGRVGTTALAALCLEIAQRYDRVLGTPKTK